jgi:hypothetical protein
MPPECCALHPAADDTLAAHALASDLATLDPAHPVNAALSEAGGGTVPQVLHADTLRRVATLVCRSLDAQLALPFGWFAIEDERHLALFEPGRQVQMQIGLLRNAGQDPSEVLDALELEACGCCPAPGGLRVRHGHMHALALRALPGERVPQEEYHLLLPGRDAATLLHARVTATPPRGRAAIDLAEALLASVDFAGRSDSETTNETNPGRG